MRLPHEPPARLQTPFRQARGIFPREMWNILLTGLEISFGIRCKGSNFPSFWVGLLYAPIMSASSRLTNKESL